MDKKRKKTIVFSILVAAGMLLSANLSAQEQQSGRHGGLFGENAPEASNGLMNRSGSTVGGSFTGQGFGATNGNITGQTFGAPLGGGLFVLLAAGAGYATMKSKKTKKQNQNRKGK
jgi:hypothetical protein